MSRARKSLPSSAMSPGAGMHGAGAVRKPAAQAIDRDAPRGGARSHLRATSCSSHLLTALRLSHTRRLLARVRRAATLAKAKAEASEILATAKAQAQDTIARSEAEADARRRRLEEELAALQHEAETRLRELKADTQAVWKERDQMLEAIGTMANDLVDIAKASVARLQPHQPAGAENESPEAGAGQRDEPTAIATDESASTAPAAEGCGSSGESRRQR